MTRTPATRPSAPGAATASAAGPMADPNSVTISPGDTPPAWYVAALVTPPALIKGPPLGTVYVTVTTGRLPTITCTLAAPAAVPRVTLVEARPVASVTTWTAGTDALVGR